MSFKANLSIVLQIHNFKNVGLPHKARYALQAHIFAGKSAKNVAMPFNILQTECKIKKNVSRESFIDDRYFRSKKFNIEFQDQEIDLNDCCQFKMNIEGFPHLEDQNIYLEFILIENNLSYFNEDLEEAVVFKEAERYRFKLQNLETGLMRYYEGQFSKDFISSFTFSLFALVTDYRFYPYTSSTNSDSSKEKSRQKIENITGLIQWAEKYLKNSQNFKEYFFKKYIKNLRYNSVLLCTELNDLLKTEKQQIKIEIPKQNGESVIVSDKQFFDYVTNYMPENITQESIRKQIYKIHQQNFYFIQKLTKNIIGGNIDRKKMKERFETERNDMFGERLIKSIIFGKEPHNKQGNSKLASKIRKKKKINELKIIDQYLFNRKQNQHYAFLEVNLPHSLKTKEYQQNSIDQVLKQISELRRQQLKYKYDERNMVIFLCHGYQASSYDMQMLKRQVSRMIPTAIIHSTICNEMNTESDIDKMGIRLADEVLNFIQRNFEETNEAIINFVGHSMGGIIARASLPYLQNFSKQMGFFYSLSTPHLGYLNGVDTMIKAGLWVMRKMNKIVSLDQLAMEDAQNLKQTFLYKLSKTGHLQNFKKIILLSSSQDSYVPWHSARMCYHDGNNSRSRLQKEMIDSILGDSIVHRVDIHFDIDSTKDIDSFIGRAAHIHLLTQECIMKLLRSAVPNLFDLRQL